MLQKGQTSSSRSNFPLQQPRPSSVSGSRPRSEAAPACAGWRCEPGRAARDELGTCKRAGESRLLSKGSSVVLLHWDIHNSIWHECWNRKINTHTTVLQKLQAFEWELIHSSWLSSNASSDLLSNHITDRVRKEAWKNTSQADHITCVSERLRHERNQKAASGKFYFLFF